MKKKSFQSAILGLAMASNFSAHADIIGKDDIRVMSLQEESRYSYVGELYSIAHNQYEPLCQVTVVAPQTVVTSASCFLSNLEQSFNLYARSKTSEKEVRNFLSKSNLKNKLMISFVDKKDTARRFSFQDFYYHPSYTPASLSKTSLGNNIYNIYEVTPPVGADLVYIRVNEDIGSDADIGTASITKLNFSNAQERYLKNEMRELELVGFPNTISSDCFAKHFTTTKEYGDSFVHSCDTVYSTGAPVFRMDKVLGPQLIGIHSLGWSLASMMKSHPNWTAAQLSAELNKGCGEFSPNCGNLATSWSAIKSGIKR